ncbi:hypothetical protein [Streptomyces sp. NPDC051567]|uniref:hypothetical protein n=1 Tax=Streptomyces sp. NPDC051567 TaxID=3365660 RepID=UPI0037915AF1
MTAWQYFAGAGLVAVLCPLHGHVAVAGDGVRIDVCVPAGPPRPPVALPSAQPPVRVAVPGGPTVRHPGRAPAPSGAPVPPEAPVPSAQAGAGEAEPPGPAPRSGRGTGPRPGGATAPGRAQAPAAASRPALRVRAYRSSALGRRGPEGISTVMSVVVVTTPAVLAAVALRPRSRSRG